MLESPALLLRDCRVPPLEGWDGSSADPGFRKAIILDPASGEALGSVQTAVKHAWLHWLMPATLTVFESEDLSYVFSLRRAWRLSAEWVVRDAEDRHVGAVIEAPRNGLAFKEFLAESPRPRALRNVMIEDSVSRCLARLGNNAAGGIVVSPAGTELAFLSRRRGETELTFAERATLSPFTRMLILAAALIA